MAQYSMRLSLNSQIFLGAGVGVAAGVVLGHSPVSSPVTSGTLFTFELLGQIFIDLLKMIVVPLIFSSIVVGVANLKRAPDLNRIWPVLLGYSITTTFFAALTGLIAVNVFKPGMGTDIHMFKANMATFEAHTQSFSVLAQTFINSVFANPVAAMAQSNILAIVIFAIVIGIGLIVLGDKAQTVHKLFTEFFQITMVAIGWIMRIAPLGVMGLLAKLAAEQNLNLLPVIGKYLAVVFGATLVHGLITLPLILWLITRIRPLQFLHAMRQAFITAFSTSSSSATLPVSLKCVTENLQVDKNIAGFVLPIGATLNMDGTALYEAIAALFVANLCGIHLHVFQQIIVALTAMLASVGAPGIPSAGMVTMIMVLQSVGLPIEAVAILIPIDRPLDTIRTAVNVEGDCAGACVVNKLGGPTSAEMTHSK